MERIVVDPKSELCQKHNSKVDKYSVEEKDSGSFVVTNLESGSTHYVNLEKVGNLEFEGSCDCEDFGFRRKQNEEPCIHIYKVVFEANLNDAIKIPEKESVDTESVDKGVGVGEPQTLADKQKQGVVKAEQKQEPQEGTEIKESVSSEVPVVRTGKVKNAVAVAKELNSVIEKCKLYSTIQGSKHVRCEGWQTLGALLHCKAIIKDVKPIDQGYEAIAEIFNSDGELMGRGISECTRKEKNWESRDDNQIKSMAQTRAIGKAYRNNFAWIVALAGYNATPFEEMNQ